MLTTDDIKRREKMTKLHWVDFLEALARVTTLKPIPPATELAPLGFGSYSDYLTVRVQEQKDRSAAEASTSRANAESLGIGNHGIGIGTVAVGGWQVQETSAAPIGEPLRMLISCIVERLGVMRDGKVSLKSLRAKAATRASGNKSAELAERDSDYPLKGGADGDAPLSPFLSDLPKDKSARSFKSSGRL